MSQRVKTTLNHTSLGNTICNRFFSWKIHTPMNGILRLSYKRKNLATLGSQWTSEPVSSSRRDLFQCIVIFGGVALAGPCFKIRLCQLWGWWRHCSHGLFFGEQISRSGQRWSNTNKDINLQLKFEFGNVQHHDFYHVEGFWQSSTCCMKDPYDPCGQVSILNNPGMAWEKETHGKRQLERRSLICKLL